MSSASQSSSHSTVPGYGTSAIVAMDRSASVLSGTSVSSGLLLSQAKSSKGSERSLESVLHASKQKVTAIESMLSGLNLSGKYKPSNLSSSLDLGMVVTFSYSITKCLSWHYQFILLPFEQLLFCTC